MQDLALTTLGYPLKQASRPGSSVGQGPLSEVHWQVTVYADGPSRSGGGAAVQLTCPIFYCNLGPTSLFQVAWILDDGALRLPAQAQLALPEGGSVASCRGPRHRSHATSLRHRDLAQPDARWLGPSLTGPGPGPPAASLSLPPGPLPLPVNACRRGPAPPGARAGPGLQRRNF